MPRINPNNRDFISLLSDFLQFYNTNLLQEDDKTHGSYGHYAYIIQRLRS
jgi:hypothetical protein